ncbi:hypothetical protein HD553DRAFT_339577 [Filobasidium floriforme]|uniref:uncharacterized protein n=1 Tax=Filobasidium floriforme TaxID=5210 RepID=UPI001E8E4C36|nr:uncharacterized protein HD553DRAFT_339577 [Filobasidium floriforme]KAH8089366.1 hypothetical protein HD553DRAFT_339577 [Filobasidium floriforme]
MEFTMESWVKEIVALEKGGDDEDFPAWKEKMFQLSNPTAMGDPPDKILKRLNTARLYMSRDDCIVRDHIVKWLTNKRDVTPEAALPTWLHALLRLMNDDDVCELLPPTETAAIKIEIDIDIVRTVLNTPFEDKRSIEQILEAAWTAAITTSSAALGEPKQRLLPLEEDFSRPYVGSADQILHGVLSAFSANKESYAAVFPILQSSGVGKTRTVVKLTDHAPGILLCIREPEAPNWFSSLPEQDKPIYEFLKLPYPTTPKALAKKRESRWIEWSKHLRFASLLAATVRLFRERFNETVKTLKISAAKPNNYEWSRIVERLRSEFTDGIVAGYRSPTSTSHTNPKLDESSNMSETSKVASPSRSSLIRSIAMLAQEFEAGSGKFGYIEPPAEVYFNAGEAHFRISVMRALAPLVASIEENLEATSASEPFRYFHVALDEFDGFSDLLTPASRVMSLLTDSPLRLLLIGMNTKLAHVTRPTVVPSSFRMTTGEKRPCQPHLVISHDIQLIQEDTYQHYRAFLQGEKQLTHSEMLDLIRYMGRPLWNGKVYQAGQGDDSSVAGIGLSHVVRKMGCKPEADENEILALAMSRLPLHVVGLQGLENTESFIQTQITQHLRCITGFASHGDIVYTNVPSEPIMSLAAAWRQRTQLYGSPGESLKAPFSYWKAAIHSIRNNQQTGVLNIGENGETYIWLIMMIAIDAVASQLPVDPTRPSHPQQVNLINLGCFLDSLYGKHPLPQIYEERKAQSWINVTHFVRLGRKFTREKPLRKRHLLELFSREAAAVGINNQGGWDILFAAYLGGIKRPGPNDKVDPSKLWFVLVQIKVDDRVGLAAMQNIDFAKTIDPDPSALSLCLFFNLALPDWTEYHEKGNMLSVFLGGRAEDRFPMIRLFDEPTRQALKGFIGYAATVSKPKNVGKPQAELEYRFRLGSYGMFADHTSQPSSSTKATQDQAANTGQTEAGEESAEDVKMTDNSRSISDDDSAMSMEEDTSDAESVMG